MRLCQFIASSIQNDAITRFAQALQIAAARRGVDAPIFAQDRHPNVRNLIRPATDYAHVAEAKDVLLYHASTASPLSELLANRTEPLVVYYHNVTPAHFFAAFAPHAADEMRQARAEIAGLAGRAERGVAASSYSATDLRNWDYRAVAVAPLIVDETLYRCADYADRSGSHRRRQPGRLLAVGRITPNKGLHDTVRTMRLLGHIDPEVHLHVVGPIHLEAYAWALRRYSERIGCTNIVWRGALSQAALIHEFEEASALVCLSQHEGFGVPLIEAMGFDVPIIALDTSAIAETCNGAALLLPHGDPQLVAASCLRVLNDKTLARHMVERGRWRWEQATDPCITEHLLDTLTVA